MKKEEYLHKALLLVSNPYTKAQVQRELEDHIEDETSFYTDAGYEREKAENMAMSRMGAPEEMARELGRLHRNLPGRMLGFSALAACVGLSVLYGFSEQWSYSLYAVMPDWLVYTLQFGNVLAVLAATARPMPISTPYTICANITYGTFIRLSPLRIYIPITVSI